ncbi:MAG: nucleotidyltransferase domain-containing protein [Bacteroidales bacterium]|nr:nucleotidyltransferase domain-containing protein [Bacteroidales bacterium]
MDKTAIIDEIILHLRTQLRLNGLNVESIALFGSALTGEMNEDSDIDLIIVSSDFQNKDLFERSELTMKPEIETLRKFKIPMDIINLTPEEYKDSQVKMYYNSRIVA